MTEGKSENQSLTDLMNAVNLADDDQAASTIMGSRSPEDLENSALKRCRGIDRNSVMKILTLNIQHGGGRRTQKIFDWLTTQNADFVLLTEWRSTASGDYLSTRLETAGYVTRSQSRGNKSNGILVASRFPFSAMPLTPPQSTKGEILLVNMDNGKTILCCYYPQMSDKEPFFDVCLNFAQSAKTQFLMIGDLNTGLNDVDLTAGGAKYNCEDRFIKLTTDAQLIDIWRSENGIDAREWTWLSPKLQNGFRIDHAFCNQSFVSKNAQITCRYDHTTRQNGFTDHSAMIVEFYPLTGY